MNLSDFLKLPMDERRRILSEQADKLAEAGYPFEEWPEIEIKMSNHEQIKQFADAIDALVDRARDEYDLPYAAVVGVFQMKIHTLCNEAAEKDPE